MLQPNVVTLGALISSCEYLGVDSSRILLRFPEKKVLKNSQKMGKVPSGFFWLGSQYLEYHQLVGVWCFGGILGKILQVVGYRLPFKGYVQ